MIHTTPPYPRPVNVDVRRNRYCTNTFNGISANAPTVINVALVKRIPNKKNRLRIKSIDILGERVIDNSTVQIASILPNECFSKSRACWK
jgi:hypothetical protein